MQKSIFHRTFAPINRLFPRQISGIIRRIATAFLFPLVNSYKSGHFRSSLKMAAVTRSGKPLPWYTYPSIDFLGYRDYVGKTVLEFGGGQSTHWWASKAKFVVTIEGNPEWYAKIKSGMPPNVELLLVEDSRDAREIEAVNELLSSRGYSSFDVIVIDGLARFELIDVACKLVTPDGIIICDDAEGYQFYEGFLNRNFKRVDFYGNAPGGLLAHCTSIYFNPTSFVFDPAVPIHEIAQEN